MLHLRAAVEEEVSALERLGSPILASTQASPIEGTGRLACKDAQPPHVHRPS